MVYLSTLGICGFITVTKVALSEVSSTVWGYFCKMQQVLDLWFQVIRELLHCFFKRKKKKRKNTKEGCCCVLLFSLQKLSSFSKSGFYVKNP